MGWQMLRFGPLGWYCRTTIGLIPKTVMALWRLRTTALVAVWEVTLKVVIDSSRQGTSIASPLRIDRGYVSAGRR